MKQRNKFKFGKSSTKRKNTVSVYLQMCAEKSIECSPIDFGIPWMGGLRLDTEQNYIYKQGNSKCDGFKNISYHQKTDSKGNGKALDLVPYIDGLGFSYEAYGHFGIIGMLMLESWEELQEEGKIPKDLYLHWGGLWSHSDPLKLGWDMAHFEIRSYKQVEKI